MVQTAETTADNLFQEAVVTQQRSRMLDDGAAVVSDSAITQSTLREECVRLGGIVVSKGDCASL